MNNALLIISIVAVAFASAFIVNTFVNIQSAQACPSNSGSTSSTSNPVVKSSLNNPQPSSQLTSSQKA